jgi:steroid delta-isomerase-like uncharacterized protein
MSQSLIDTAKASILAYNDKNWDAVNTVLTSDIEYDEVATHRKVNGTADVIAAWRGWATALPDSKATFGAAHASGNTAVIELTWHGTHTGPLQMPSGAVQGSGKRIEMRAVQIIGLTPEGKTRTVRHYFDMATMLTQLGIGTVGA